MTYVMNRLAIRLALVGSLLAAPSLGLGACKATHEAPTVARVDCSRLCKKTFTTCGREVFIKSGKLRVDKARLFKVLGILKKVKAEGLETCLKGCGGQRGLFADAAKVNQCLEIQDCTAFAACITKYIK